MGATDNARPFVAIRPWLRAGLLRCLSPTASEVLFLMVDFCGKDGLSFPKAETLAERTGHTRETVYAAIKELVAIGCLESRGRTRFSSHNHPGPMVYAVAPFDSQDEGRLRRLPSRKASRGNARRFAKVSLAEPVNNFETLTVGI